MFYMGFQYWSYYYSGDEMRMRDKLMLKKKKLSDQMERGREVSIQKRDKRRRKKIDKLTNMKPGARQAIAHGMAMKKHPLDVMKEEYSRRRKEREKRKENIK